MKPYRLYAFDLDGTLYRGGDVIPHAVEVVQQLRANGAEVRFVTNNSGRTRQDFAEKLTKMGFDCAPHEVVSSGTGTAQYVKDSFIRTAYVVGEPGLVATLREAGVAVVNALPNGLTVPQPPVTTVDAVIAGICRHFDYAMVDGAMQHIRNGARFVATNRDATFPMEAGRLQPGAGTIVAAIETCSGTVPFVVGKPNPYLIETLVREADVLASDVLVVGDRIDTDIECGKRAGCDTFLVLTGVETWIPTGQPGSADLRGLLG